MLYFDSQMKIKEELERISLRVAGLSDTSPSNDLVANDALAQNAKERV